MGKTFPRLQRSRQPPFPESECYQTFQRRTASGGYLYYKTFPGPTSAGEIAAFLDRRFSRLPAVLEPLQSRGIAMPRSAQSALVAFVGRQLLSAADAETAPSFLRFAAIQCIKRKKDLTDVAPKGCFISTEAIEGVVGQIGKSQKATRKLSVMIDGRVDKCRIGAGHGF
jgi:hypothetical protein